MQKFLRTTTISVIAIGCLISSAANCMDDDSKEGSSKVTATKNETTFGIFGGYKSTITTVTVEPPPPPPPPTNNQALGATLIMAAALGAAADGKITTADIPFGIVGAIGLKEFYKP